MALHLQLLGFLIIVASVILNFGNCNKVCGFDRVGPDCQFKNIAYGKPSRHDSNIIPAQYSDRANDNDSATCSFTFNNPSVHWWNLFIQNKTTFKKFEFDTKDGYQGNFANFKVTVHNTDELNFKGKRLEDSGKTCYQHNNSTPKSTKIQVTCGEPLEGNLIRIQLEKQLVLCDFRLYEDCKDEFYGDGCEQCSSNCRSLGPRICDFNDGRCLHGCTDGWKGYHCKDKCDNGKWGNNCTKDCGKCLSQPCNHVNGHCRSSECVAGYKSSLTCKTECADWTYGLKCGFKCDNCANVCDKKTGICSKCKPGWKGHSCTEQCDNGTWGQNCTNKCGKCLYKPCDKVDGKCRDAKCAAGYMRGWKCKTECNNGKYGFRCENSCSVNCADVCDKETGMCSECKPGWKGHNCTKQCDDGKWGVNCAYDCGKCLFQPCNHVNGYCRNGCIAGYKTTKECKTKCGSGKWGVNCANDCGKCVSQQCNHLDGICRNGCIAGYKTTKECKTECDNGTYGMKCENSCSVNCADVCDKETGMCSECKPGWKGHNCTKQCDDGTYGVKCESSCSENCVNVCDKEKGKCSYCRNGWKGYYCTEQCEEGTYGKSCLQNCSNNCKTICNRINGTCDKCRLGWTGDFCEVVLQDSASFSNKSTTTSGIVSALTVVLILVLIGGTVFMYFRRKQKTERRNNELQAVTEATRDIKDDRVNVKLDGPSNSVSYVNASELVHKMREINAVSNDKGNGKSTFIEERKVEVEYSIPKTAHGVQLTEFETYVRSGLANTEIFFQQFQQIPYGMQYASDVATKPKNHCKNRYKAMYAYDHSRVILRTLPDQPGSDYINASKIMGNTGKVSYIAAQGPISSTLGDFWRMIWEQTVRTIVMLTNLTEEGKMKCLKYWPEAGEFVEHGNIVVLSELEDVFAEFTIRRLKIHQKNKPDRARTLAHFHFTAWPDKDVPRSTSCLLHFWHQVRNHDEKKARPWLVHCSAGVGRTGTFIGLDVLCDMGKDYGFVDVFKCVDDLRKQRVNMVQTKNQYKYLHCAVLEALVLPSEPAHMDNFHAIYNHLKMTDPEAGKTSLLMQYETLTNDCEVITSVEDPNEDKYAVAKRDENRNKNRFDDILAPGECRPFLLTKVPGCTDYINAIFIPGYRDKFGYILTQTPLQSTAIDCCRLVYEQEIKVIVTFQEYSKKDVGIYLPNEGTANFGPFTMKFLSEKEMTYYTKRNYTLLYKSETHAVSQLIFKHWPPSRMTPPDPTKMLNFLENLDTLRRQNDCKPILVQCFNGAERSGLVVALMNILEQLKFNKEVSIPLVVRQLKCRRQQIIPNFEQFTFCYDVVLSHIESHTTYANM